MTTYNQIVSKVTNVMKFNTKDSRISKRFILKVLKDTLTQLLSQKWMDRTILNETNLYTNISCFEFEKQDVVKCPIVEFRRCDTLMKSKHPLPKLIFSRLGSSIKEIYSLDYNFKFTFVDKSQYAINKKRRYSLKDEVYVYLDSDMHLYIPDNEIYAVNLTVLTPNPEDVLNCEEKDLCKSNWEYEFKCPDKLLDVVFTQTLQVLGVNRQIRTEENPNNVEGI